MKTQQEKFSWKNRGKSFGYAFKGVKYFFKTQHNSWIHFGAAIIVVSAGFFFNLSAPEWLWIIFSIGFVFFAELMNTAIELVIDLVSPDYHEIAGKAKDVAAGAVLVAAITAACIGLMIFSPKLIHSLGFGN